MEFWAEADTNSGVFIRCQDPAKIEATTCYEVNIYDKRPDPTYRTGAIVEAARALAVIDAANKWNTFEITARGSHMTVTLNGTKTADGQHSAHARGRIALQSNGGMVKFRSVRIRPL